jgi:protein SCO1
MISNFCNKYIYLALLFGAFLCNHSVLAVQNVNDLSDIGIDERPGNQIPIELEFTNSNNQVVSLSEYFLDNKPVILNLVYFSCPRVCNYAISGVVDVVNKLSSIYLGRDFRILTISFDERDSFKESELKIADFYKLMNNNHNPKGNWHFLSGDAENIKQLTESVGFKYKKDGDEFAHTSSLIIITPGGKVARYLYGIQHEQQDLKLALLEASKGEIGNSKFVNKALLFCYQFDPVGKKYALKAINVVKAGGVLTLLSLGVFLTYYWRREGHTKT